MKARVGKWFFGTETRPLPGGEGLGVGISETGVDARPDGLAPPPPNPLPAGEGES